MYEQAATAVPLFLYRLECPAALHLLRLMVRSRKVATEVPGRSRSLSEAMAATAAAASAPTPHPHPPAPPLFYRYYIYNTAVCNKKSLAKFDSSFDVLRLKLQ